MILLALNLLMYTYNEDKSKIRFQCLMVTGCLSDYWSQSLGVLAHWAPTESSSIPFSHSGWCNPDSKVHGANMGPIWVLSALNGPHVGPMNLAIRSVVQPAWPMEELHAFSFNPFVLPTSIATVPMFEVWCFPDSPVPAVLYIYMYIYETICHNDNSVTLGGMGISTGNKQTNNETTMQHELCVQF